MTAEEEDIPYGGTTAITFILPNSILITFKWKKARRRYKRISHVYAHKEHLP